ncbi:sulfite exporter TauE/SafE family protein [Rossellomorea marisflavi]|uniref:sulfite exporter TauE/SafE family protein n=1 Tax=Rossellomorea marisflavi TaxID=189381 RepID=UPI00296E969D|nr:sulfite exporter TauE/SafE family protein [Rossellomorea marisflavi]MDW4525736.1 sulfite exporter TauE/SafE family protein [Rossellomorea marisflavi]
MEWIYFIIGGAFIGILSGFFGIGGGIVLTPTLLVLGYDPGQAIILSLMLTLGSTVTGTISHIRLKNVNGRLAIILGIAGVIGSTVTAPFVKWLEASNGASLVISIAYIAILGWFSYQFFRKEKSDAKPKGKGAVPVIGFITGVISSLMGVSGGFVMTPLLSKWIRLDLKKAIGTSITAASIIVLSGIGSYMAAGETLDYRHGVLLIAGALIGTPIGSTQLKNFATDKVKRMLAFLYIIVAASVILKLLQIPTLSLILIGAAMVAFFAVLINKQRKEPSASA